MSESADETQILYRDAAGDDVLDVRRLRPKVRKFTLPGDESGKVYRLDGAVTVDLMIDLFDTESSLLELRGTELRAECARLASLIRSALADDPANGDVPEFTLSRQEALTLTAFIAGRSSVAEAVQHVITAGGIGPEKPDGTNEFDDAEELAKEHLDRESDDPPTRSPRRSGSRSSRSEKPGAGRRSGGEDAPGKRSRSTASTRSSKAADGGAS